MVILLVVPSWNGPLPNSYSAGDDRAEAEMRYQVSLSAERGISVGRWQVVERHSNDTRIMALPRRVGKAKWALGREASEQVVTPSQYHVFGRPQ